MPDNEKASRAAELQARIQSRMAMVKLGGLANTNSPSGYIYIFSIQKGITCILMMFYYVGSTVMSVWWDSFVCDTLFGFGDIFVFPANSVNERIISGRAFVSSVCSFAVVLRKLIAAKLCKITAVIPAETGYSSSPEYHKLFYEDNKLE